MLDNGFCLLVKHLYKVAANYLAFMLGIRYSCKVRQKLFAGIYPYHIQAQAFVIAHHIGKFVLSKHTMINEDTGQLVTDSPIQQYGTNATVNATGQAKYYAVCSYLLT